MITDAQCADLCAAIYQGAHGQDHAFKVYDPGDDDGICWAIERTDDADVIVLRGSASLGDWVRNLMALALPFTHHKIGPVHPGFLLGMEHAMEDIIEQLDARPVIITGHSLGAARASILAALMIEEGITPVRIVRFASPKPGFSELGDVLRDVRGVSYRNGSDSHHDVVTDLPLTFPPEDYVHPGPLTYVAQMPDAGDSLGMFAFHRIAYYQQALRKLGTQPKEKA